MRGAAERSVLPHDGTQVYIFYDGSCDSIANMTGVTVDLHVVADYDVYEGCNSSWMLKMAHLMNAIILAVAVPLACLILLLATPTVWCALALQGCACSPGERLQVMVLGSVEAVTVRWQVSVAQAHRVVALPPRLHWRAAQEQMAHRRQAPLPHAGVCASPCVCRLALGASVLSLRMPHPHHAALPAPQAGSHRPSRLWAAMKRCFPLSLAGPWRKRVLYACVSIQDPHGYSRLLQVRSHVLRRPCFSLDPP